MSWNDFNSAEEQIDRGGLIPAGTLVKVILKIRPGGYDDPANGWTGGLATRKQETGAVYLDAEYTVMGGVYDRRKVWTLIGLHSPKGENWGNSGRAFIRGALESARGIKPDDKSDQARMARQINSLGDLNGLVFAAKVEVEKGNDGYQDKNKIQYAVPASHRDYASVMAGQSVQASLPIQQSGGGSSKPSAAAPAWAQ